MGKLTVYTLYSEPKILDGEFDYAPSADGTLARLRHAASPEPHPSVRGVSQLPRKAAGDAPKRFLNSWEK